MAEAYVTLATNDSYAVGALVLAHSLRQVGTNKFLAVLVTSGVSDLMRQQLGATFDSLTYVDILDSNDAENLQLLSRPDLGITFTKLHCWRLTQYTKCVFMDADTLVLQNIDDLFEREELSASPDIGWPDCFNSGVFVFRPSLDTYRALLSFAMTVGSFDGGDQGLLNLYFRDWATDMTKRLPYVYNVVSQTFYTYLPAYKQFGKDVKVIHFIGAQKPWHMAYNMATSSIETYGDQPHDQEFLLQWWKLFVDKVKPLLSNSVLQINGDICRLNVYSEQQLISEDRQSRWESGQADYMGIDAFSNIQRQLDTVLHVQPKPSAPAQVNLSGQAQAAPKSSLTQEPKPVSSAKESSLSQVKVAAGVKEATAAPPPVAISVASKQATAVPASTTKPQDPKSSTKTSSITIKSSAKPQPKK